VQALPAILAMVAVLLKWIFYSLNW
jgi:hypothetical protein